MSPRQLLAVVVSLMGIGFISTCVILLLANFMDELSYLVVGVALLIIAAWINRGKS